MSIEKKYKKLSDIDHCLLRPGMWIGNVSQQNIDVPCLVDGVFSIRSTTFSPAFIKLFDEIISNSMDEHRRNPKLNKIEVIVDRSGWISVYDNGGIPVVQHKEHKEWIPQMIFSNLRAGSNFNDDEQRSGAGLHGVGATLTNIFSTKFIIETCDGKNSYHQEFRNNMKVVGKPIIHKSSRPFTKITYYPELSRFGGMTEISEDTIFSLKKRALDIAATNSKLTVVFNGEVFRFKSFEDYVRLYTPDFIYEESKDWRVAFGKSDGGFSNVSFVNSVHTRDGGTHVEYVVNQLVSEIRELIRKKHKVEVKPAEIRNHMSVFIDCTVVNPAFSSQTKEKLITEAKDFGTKHEVAEKTIKAVFKSEIIQSVLDWVEKKAEAQERAELRKLNSSLSGVRVPKLIDAQKKGDRSSCVLGIYEGLSALSAVRKIRDSQTQGAFPLKGKFLNVSEMKSTEIIKNDEAVQLMAALGLKLGEDPVGLRYGRIYIYTDADPDGNSIAGLLINFFNRFWPQLFEKGRVFKVMTPLVVAKRGKESINFYTSEEFDSWSKKTNIKSWEIEYKKGLGALEDAEYEDIIHRPKLVQIKNDKDYKDSLEAWFGPDSTPRKERILNQTK